MVHCVAYGCNNQSAIKCSGITYHRFPKNVDRRKQWMVAIRRQNWSPTPYSRVCSIHFEDQNFDRTSLRRTYLREDAIPTIFPAFPARLKRKLKKRESFRRSTLEPEIIPSPPDSEELSRLWDTIKKQKKQIRTLQRTKLRMKKKLASLKNVSRSALKFSPLMMANIRNSGQIASGNEGLNCFVCDAVVVGSYNTLASCRTQKTKVRLIEKLGQLVGDQYMVVISEDDVICRACTSMINNLDRLEREMFTVRTVVLKFLEKKYDLDEGELVNTRISIPAQKFANISSLKKTNITDASSRKRKAAAMEADEVDLVSSSGNNNSKTNMWLQCDKCQYKTPYNSFMVNHIQRHSPQNNTAVPNEKEKLNDVLNEPPPLVSKSVNPEPVVSEPEVHVPKPENKSENLNSMNVITEPERPTEPETVEMISAEINDLGVKEVVNGINAKVIPVNLVQDVVSPKQEFIDDQQHNLTLEVEGEEGVLDTTNAICMVDENGMILHKMEQAEDGTYYMHVMESDSTKQVLSVNDDGTIQMVEVLWDGIGGQTVNVDDNIPF